MSTLSIRQRLTLWYVAAVAVLLIAVSLGVVILQGRMQVRRLDAELMRLNATLATVLRHELDEGLLPKAAAEDALDEVIAADRGLAIFSSDGTVLASNGSPTPVADMRMPAIDRIWTDPQSAPAFRAVARVSPPVPPGFIVVSAAPANELTAARNAVIEALLIVIPVGLIASTAGAWWVAGRALRPAAQMAAEAERITSDAAGARLTGGRDDELGRLASTFNGLLDRLEHALNARRDFLADVSHELRTPVSIARAAADVTLARNSRSEAEYREALSVISGQMKRLTAMVGDLLTLARSDLTDWPIMRQDFYFDELLQEVIRAMRVLADERQVTMRASCPPDTQIAGDEQLLRQMLFNLLENAVRHTPSGGVVEVVAESLPGELRLAVCDTGTGIAAPRRDRLFERFGRLDSRSHHGRMGLGLAIGRRIARAHGGDLTLVATGPTGSTFGVTIPRA